MLKCNVCNLLLRNPTKTSCCKLSACNECIVKVFENGKDKCFNKNCTNVKSSYFVDRSLEKRLRKFVENKGEEQSATVKVKLSIPTLNKEIRDVFIDNIGTQNNQFSVRPGVYRRDRLGQVEVWMHPDEDDDIPLHGVILAVF